VGHGGSAKPQKKSNFGLLNGGPKLGHGPVDSTGAPPAQFWLGPHCQVAFFQLSLENKLSLLGKCMLPWFAMLCILVSTSFTKISPIY
jgi:hypothetical protein